MVVQIAGTPTAVAFAGTSRSTTALAPTVGAGAHGHPAENARPRSELYVGQDRWAATGMVRGPDGHASLELHARPEHRVAAHHRTRRVDEHHTRPERHVPPDLNAVERELHGLHHWRQRCRHAAAGDGFTDASQDDHPPRDRPQ
jgi:hypothetical protein